MNNIIETWKERKTLKGEKSSSYNTHRSICYTHKGKIIGYPANWQLYKDFLLDAPEGFQEGYILLRKDKSLPYSKENCYWAAKGTENIHKLSVVEYKGETKTLLEWCKDFNINYGGARMRFFKGKNYTPEEILFGKTKKLPKGITSIDELATEQKRKDKISKMLSSYKLKDKKKGLDFNLTAEYLTDNIIYKACTYCGDIKNIGCDRILNTKGHTVDNVVPCCYSCNATRNNLYTHEEMLILGETIKQIKSKRTNG